MSTRIDKTISKVAGVNNYMNQLAKITGNIHTVDKPYYLQQIEKLKRLEEELNTLLQTNVIEFNLSSELDTRFKKLNLETVYIIKPPSKKSKKAHPKPKEKLRLRPEDIYASEWFKLIKEISKNIQTIMKQFEIESDQFTDNQKKIIEQDEKILDVYKFYGGKMDNSEIYKIVFNANKIIVDIMELILSPAYDMKNYIIKNWNPRIDEVVGSQLQNSKNKELSEASKSLTTQDIQHYVYIFVLSKYKFEITGAPDAFIKNIMNEFDDVSMGNITPDKFISIVDNIKFDKIGNNKNVKLMAELAKKEVKKLSENDKITPDEIMKDIDEFFTTLEKPNDEEMRRKEQIEKAAEEIKEQEDVF